MEKEVFCPEFVESCYMCWTGCGFCNYGYVSEETARNIREERKRRDEKKKEEGGDK